MGSMKKSVDFVLVLAFLTTVVSLGCEISMELPECVNNIRTGEICPATGVESYTFFHETTGVFENGKGSSESWNTYEGFRDENHTCYEIHETVDVFENGKYSSEFWNRYQESADDNLEKFVALETAVTLPLDTQMITLDIVHNFDMYVEFHQDANRLDNVGFTLEIEKEGDNTLQPEFSFDYKVASLATETEILVTLNYVASDKEENLNLSVMMATSVVVLAVVMSSVSLHKRNRKITTTAIVKTNEQTKSDEGLRQSSPSSSGCPTTSFPQCQIGNPDLARKPEQLPRLRFDPSIKQQDSGTLRGANTIAVQEAHLEKHHGNGESTINQEKKEQPPGAATPSLPMSLTDFSTKRSETMMEQMHPSSFCYCEEEQNSIANHVQDTRYLRQACHNGIGDPLQNHASLSRREPMGIRNRLRGVAFVIFATFVVVAVALGVSKLRAKPTLHVNFPASNLIRKVRMFSDFPDLTQLTKNHSSLSLLSRLQLLDTQRCKDDLKTCKISVVCDSSTDQSVNCRCRNGYFFKDWTCHACTSRCPSDHYLASPCSDTANTICKACTVCGKTQYEAAQCNSQRDTICIDVSFPVGILPMNKSHLADDGIAIAVSYSSNVFMERLIDMEALETPMYVTNNQQSLDFVWPRLSGLDIAVSVSGVYLVPDYRDVEAVDDTALFHKLLEPSQNTKDYYNYVQSHYCRHPVPDYYSLQLLIIKNRTSSAQVIRCDSQDDSVPRCPSHYKDGDRYLKWNINAQCPALKTPKPEVLKDGPNSIVCTDETEILRKVFSSARPTTQEYMFPSEECQRYRRQCQNCLQTSQCPAGKFNSTESYLNDNQCCGIPCYTKNFCQRAYSPACPQPKVECATGEVNIFSLFPHFDSMDRQFACNLKYEPPQHLYSISYTIRAPSINFNMTPQHFVVTPSSRKDHERRLSKFDFIGALHDTRLKVEDELMLIGDHMELMHYHDSLMKPYTVRNLKTPKELGRKKRFTQNYMSKSAYIQFEKPFLYSSLSWYQDGCHKNMSQIYPNQTIYKEDFTPVMARRNVLDQAPGTSTNKHPGYTYQLYHRDRAPYVKFFVEKGKSVLQHLQGPIVKGKLIPSSLYGKVSWHHDTSTWKLVFSGQQDECPSVITLKIFTQLMTGCAGHFDLLINCPEDFTVTFNFSTGMSDLPDIFILQVNDSATSHNLVLSSVYSPIHVDEITSKDSEGVRDRLSSGDDKDMSVSIWLPIILIVAMTLILLLITYISYRCINSKVKRVVLSVTANSDGEAVALNNKGETVNQTITASGARHRPRCFICIFVSLYIIYSLLFTFSVTCGIIYAIQSSVWANITNSEHLGKELQIQVNKSLLEIQKFEEGERLRLFKLYQERRTACIYHLEKENRKLLLDYEKTTKKQIDAIFVENGTLHHFTYEIQKQNVSAYMYQIHEFVSDCNKTIHAIVDRFQANYFQFLRNTALNDWLKVPRQIFLYQDGEDPDRKFLSSTQVKQFASWLEIDKTEELLATRENVFGRLSSIPLPQISTLDVTFPSLHPHLTFGLPDFHFSADTYTYTVLEPSVNADRASPNSSAAPSKTIIGSRTKRDAEAFGLSGNLKYNPDHDNFSDFTEEKDEQETVDFQDESDSDLSFDKDASYKTEHLPDHLPGPETLELLDDLPIGVMNVVKIKDDDNSSTIISDNPAKPEALTSESSSTEPESQTKGSNTWLYILIALFLFLDIVLWVYRYSWISSQLYAIRHGYADRIPTDDACKQVLEIQTAYHLPAFEDPNDESSGFYVDGKEQLYTSSSDREADITFLQALPKSKDDILQKIWNEKMQKADDRAEVRMRKCFLVRWYGDFRRVLHRLLLSQLVWQGCLTFLAITFICVFVYCVEFWLTADNFRTLVGGQSAAADVQWHLDTSDRYLHGLAQQLTSELQRLMKLCDSEVNVLTDMFFTTVNMQTSVFTDTLQRLCREAKGKHCDKLVAHQSTGGRIVGCNFLPLQAQTFHDLSLSHMEAVVAKEVTPLMNLSQRMLTVSTSVVVFLLCSRLLCQAVASIVRHYLLLTGRLPRVRVYQTEEPQGPNVAANSTTMQRSQSWVDSCESGVYVGEVDDANKEETR